jgi:SpoVK/Ycf46/Vps4 family AAA+-type ATPase
MLSWLTADQLLKIVGAAGLGLTANTLDSATATTPNSRFSLPGRKDLEAFFVEHVVDIVEHPGRYRAFGIDFPGAIVLHGPPGTGKTFAIERLVEFLKWPSFQVDASSVGSPYIHETSRKVADIFERAARDAPSVLVIDEMEAFLSDREMGTGHHRVEEVAEFLRRIPEATRRRVLIVGMTNRLEMIDPAVLRRGRFDHVVEVKPASKVEIEELLRKLIATLPVVPDLDVTGLAAQLADRPLSDVTFVVREAGRVAARAGKNRLDLESIQRAIDQTPDPTAPQGRKIGFI